MHLGESEEDGAVLIHRRRLKWHKYHDVEGTSGEATHPRPDIPQVTVNGVKQNDTVSDVPNGDARPSEDHRTIEETQVQEHERSKSNLSHRSKDTARTGHSSVHTIASNIISRFKSVASHRSRPATSGRTTSSSSASPTSSDDESSDNDHQPSIMDPSVSHPAGVVYGDVDHFGEKIEVEPGTPRADTRNEDAKEKKKKHVSRHTFYIENSQQRLKIVARSEVKSDYYPIHCVHRQSTSQRQTQQWISALERMQQSSFWSGRNRFDSFAPIRLNVATQWLVDGVSVLPLLFPHTNRTQSEGLLLEPLTCDLHGQEVYLHSWVVANAR